MPGMRRREFVSLFGGAAAVWPIAARAQQSVVPVVGLITGFSADAAARYVAAFRKGLNQTGHVEGQNVTVEYYWLEGHYESPAGTDGRSGPPTGGRDRHAGQHRQLARFQSCNSDHPDRLQCPRRPDPAWSCRQPRPARWQRDWHQFFQLGTGGQAVAAPA